MKRINLIILTMIFVNNIKNYIKKAESTYKQIKKQKILDLEATKVSSTNEEEKINLDKKINAYKSSFDKAVANYIEELNNKFLYPKLIKYKIDSILKAGFWDPFQETLD